jgi:hypothetical protein
MNLRPIPLAILVLATVGCSGDDDATSPTTVDTTTSVEPNTTAQDTTSTTGPPSTTSTTSTSTSTSAPPSTTDAVTSTTSVPSTTVGSDVDWLEVVEDLAQRRQDLYASPDISRIPEVCADGSPCAEQLNVQIGDLADKGWRVDGADPVVVLDTRVEQFDGDTLDSALLVTVVAVIERAQNAGTIVDGSGSEVAAVEPGTEPGFNAQGRFLLGRVGPPEDPWRLVSQDTLPEVPA